MQNDVSPEPLCPITINENGYINIRSSHMDGQAVIRLSP